MSAVSALKRVSYSECSERTDRGFANPKLILLEAKFSQQAWNLVVDRNAAEPDSNAASKILGTSAAHS